MITRYFPRSSGVLPVIVLILVGFWCTVLIPVAAGADVDIEGILGETITLHGYSYIGDSVYLFLTGPGLPSDGVTLTDISQRADQGHFTVVELDQNQAWTYSWKTSRIASEIDPGTYTVYVTNKPVDRSDLGAENSYKTISVFLRESGVPKISIGAEHVYTPAPKEEVSPPPPEPSITVTIPTQTETTVPTVPERTTVPSTRAGTGPWAVVSALLCSAVFLSLLKSRS